MRRILRKRSWTWSSRRNAGKGGQGIEAEDDNQKENIDVLSSSSSSLTAPTATPTFNLGANNVICNIDMSPSSSTSSDVSLLESIEAKPSSQSPPKHPHPYLRAIDYNHSSINLVQDNNDDIKSPSIYEMIIPKSVSNPLYTGVPANRLGLLDNSEILAFKFQLHHELNHIEQNYYYRWLVWCYKKDNHKSKSILRCIETLRDLNDFFNHEYHELIYKNQFHQFFITRYGIIPNRRNLVDGYTLELKISKTNEDSPSSKESDGDGNDAPLSESSIKKFLSFLLKAILSNEIYNNLDNLQISVCGVGYKLHFNSIQISIWIYPIQNQVYNDEFLIQQIQILIKTLRFNICNDFEYLFDKVLLMSNNDDSTIILEFI